jgi:hypothetical protein
MYFTRSRQCPILAYGCHVQLTMLHRMIGANRQTKVAILSSTPVNYELGGSSDVMKSAVVSRPSRLPLDALKTCLQWEASDALSISLKGSLDTPQDIIQEASKCAPEVLLGLLETKGEYVVTPSAEWTGFDYDSVVTLLRAWESAGIVKSFSPPEGDARWSLTEHGTALVESGFCDTKEAGFEAKGPSHGAAFCL